MNERNWVEMHEALLLVPANVVTRLTRPSALGCQEAWFYVQSPARVPIQTAPGPFGLSSSSPAGLEVCQLRFALGFNVRAREQEPE